MPSDPDYDAAFMTNQIDEIAMGRRMRIARKHKKMTLKQMGSLMGITGNALQGIETGGSMPRPYQIKVLEDVVGVDWNFIYAGRYTRLDYELVAELYEVAKALPKPKSDKSD